MHSSAAVAASDWGTERRFVEIDSASAAVWGSRCWVRGAGSEGSCPCSHIAGG